jgi:uncharacterized protein YbaA (DUF1428 family)
MAKKFGYVDGFVLPIPRKNKAAYKKMATLCAKIWKEYGAIDYVECIADQVKKGKTTDFQRSVKLKKGEVVWFSWITYKSKKQRDAIMKKIMKDPRLDGFAEGQNLPFDGMRMIWGGFKPEVKA